VAARRRLWTLAALGILSAGAAANAEPLGPAATGTIAYHSSMSVSGETSGPFIDDIYTVEVGEARARNLTRNGTRIHDSLPAWSPDGSRLAFVRRDDRRRDAVFIMNADGSRKRMVTSYPGPDREFTRLAWSPDGRRIAFVRNTSVWVVNSDGTAPRRLIRDAGLPAWSPDGSIMLFVRRRHGEGSPTEIWIANADGSRQRRLTHNQQDELSPAWSPDGRLIAFSRGEPGVFVMGRNGTAARRVTRGGDWPFCLTWSPDARIAFCRGGGIAVVDVGGGRPRTLVRPDAIESAAWSPIG
jgi:Tol biopolymer transport system component